MRRRLRPVLFRVILVLGGLTVGLLTIELGVRLALDLYRADESLGWTFVPAKTGLKYSRRGEFFHPVRINALGFRDDVERFVKPDGVQRILTLGDSFVAGLQVRREETFQNVLEERLNDSARAGTRFEVVNAGVDGYGTAQELILYEERAHRFDADVVVLALFPYNDLSDNSIDAGSIQHWLSYIYGRPYFVLQNGGLEQTWRQGMSHWNLEGPLSRLLRNSILYTTFVPVPAGATTVLPFRHADIYGAEYPPALRESWAVTRALLRRARDRIRRDGSHFAVAVVPEKRAVTGDRDTSALSTTLRQEDGIPVIDLETALEQRWRDEGRPLYFERDPHWNAGGHAVVAEALERWLRDHCDELALDVPPCGPRMDRPGAAE